MKYRAVRKARSDFTFRLDIYLSHYTNPIFFHGFSPSIAQLECVVVLKPLRFLGEKLFDMIFRVDHIP